MVEPNEHDIFEMRQRIRPVINQYEFTLPGGQPVCFVEQARFKFKEDIRFYADDSKKHELMRLQGAPALRPERPLRRHDRGGRPGRQIQKVFGASLLRSTYTLFDAAGQETAKVDRAQPAIALSAASSA